MTSILNIYTKHDIYTKQLTKHAHEEKPFKSIKWPLE